MNQVNVVVYKDFSGFKESGYIKSIPIDVNVLGIEAVQIFDEDMIGCGPDAPETKNLLKLYHKTLGWIWVDDTIESFHAKQSGICCVGSGSGGSSGGALFTETVSADGPTFQDDRLIGADVPAFVLAGTFYQSGYTFVSSTGTVTLTTPPFEAGQLITFFDGRTASITIIAIAGNEITSPLLVNRIVTAIIFGGTISNDNYTKLLTSDTLTYNDTTEFTGGELITLILS